VNHPSGTELLDDPSADPAAVRRSLANIARSNRLFGGTDAVLWGLDRVLPHDARRTTHDFSLLDLGTGAGDIPAAARVWAAERGVSLRTMGLERLRPAAQLARSAALPVVLGCVGALPVRTAGVDLVVISQVLHHLDTAAATRLLREASRIARVGVVVADLRRSRTAAALFSVASHALGFDVHTREDGITSVGRGYRREELERLCTDAGVHATVTDRPGWRIVAWWTAP
jgi:ubiquinone/menaquinone biosynthesis C-methylase UbiE